MKKSTGFIIIAVVAIGIILSTSLVLAKVTWFNAGCCISAQTTCCCDASCKESDDCCCVKAQACSEKCAETCDKSCANKCCKDLI